jgi:hypothetical protein
VHVLHCHRPWSHQHRYQPAGFPHRRLRAACSLPPSQEPGEKYSCDREKLGGAPKRKCGRGAVGGALKTPLCPLLGHIFTMFGKGRGGLRGRYRHCYAVPPPAPPAGAFTATAPLLAGGRRASRRVGGRWSYRNCRKARKARGKPLSSSRVDVSENRSSLSGPYCHTPTTSTTSTTSTGNHTNKRINHVGCRDDHPSQRRRVATREGREARTWDPPPPHTHTHMMYLRPSVPVLQLGL